MFAVASTRRRGRGAGDVTQYFWQYGTLGALSLLGVGFVAFAFGANRVMRPRKPRPRNSTPVMTLSIWPVSPSEKSSQ